MSETNSNGTVGDPVARYYVTRKRRYLKDPDAAAEMITGTPHDWEDARGYEAPADPGRPQDTN